MGGGLVQTLPVSRPPSAVAPAPPAAGTEPPPSAGGCARGHRDAQRAAEAAVGMFFDAHFGPEAAGDRGRGPVRLDPAAVSNMSPGFLPCPPGYRLFTIWTLRLF